MSSVIDPFFSWNADSGPILVGISLTAVVNLNQAIQAMLPELTRPPRRGLFDAVEEQVTNKAILEMHAYSCKKHDHSIDDNCGSVMSTDDYRYIQNTPKLLSHYGSDMYSSTLPLSSLLTLAEGNLTTAHALLGDRVSFVLVNVKNSAKCGVTSTPEFSMAKSNIFNYFSRDKKAQEFTKSWDELVTKVTAIATISSRQTGPVMLTKEHMSSLNRTLWRTKSLFEKMYAYSYIPRIKIVAAACKSIRGFAIYGKHGGGFSARPINGEEVILANSGFPGEYFSAIVSFTMASDIIIHM